MHLHRILQKLPTAYTPKAQVNPVEQRTNCNRQKQLEVESSRCSQVPDVQQVIRYKEINLPRIKKGLNLRLQDIMFGSARCGSRRVGYSLSFSRFKQTQSWWAWRIRSTLIPRVPVPPSCEQPMRKDDRSAASMQRGRYASEPRSSHARWCAACSRRISTAAGPVWFCRPCALAGGRRGIS